MRSPVLLWLLALLVEKLGLKLVSRKEGTPGKQVRIYVQAEAERDFALRVKAHRASSRVYKETREQELRKRMRRYQVAMHCSYGIAPPPSPVSSSAPGRGEEALMKAKRSVSVTLWNKGQIHPTARGLQYFRSRGGFTLFRSTGCM